MTDCIFLNIEDIALWHNDIFDHPDYEYTCRKSNRKVIPCIHCNSSRCKNYKPEEE